MAHKWRWVVVLALGVSLVAGSARAQDAPTEREPRVAILTGGIVMLAGGYLGSIVWGTYTLADRPLGVLGCNDTYAGWHFLPLAGPVVGMFAGGACVPDQLHVEEAVIPVVLGAIQLGGLILSILGAVIRERSLAATVSVAFDETGGRVTASGAF